MNIQRRIAYFFIMIIGMIMLHNVIPHPHYFEIISSHPDDPLCNETDNDAPQNVPFHCHAFNGLLFEENNPGIQKIVRVQVKRITETAESDVESIQEFPPCLSPQPEPGNGVHLHVFPDAFSLRGPPTMG